MRTKNTQLIGRRQLLLSATTAVVTGCGGGDGRSIGSASSGGKAQAQLTIYWGSSSSTRGRFIPLNANLVIVSVRDHQRNEIPSRRAVRGTAATETLTFGNLPSGEVIFEALAFETANPETDTPSRASALAGSGEKVVRLYSGSDNAVALSMNSLIDSIRVFQGTVESTEFVVKLGASISLSAVRYQGGVPLAGGVIVWESSDSSIASVDASGAIRGLKIGVILLKVREQGNSDTGMTGTVHVTVSFFSASSPQYTAIEVPRLPGYDSSDLLVVQGMNDLGQVVGYCWGTWKPYRGFIWDSASGIRELSIDGKIFLPSAINNKGQICGNYTFDDAHRHPVILNPDGIYIDLYQSSNIGYNSTASSINGNGIVVGAANFGNKNGSHAVIWSQNGNSFIYCNNPPSSFVVADELAVQINNKNEVVGYSRPITENVIYGFLFQSSTYSKLGGGTYLYSDAISINDSSVIAGDVISSDGQVVKAAVWESGKEVRVLPGVSDPNGEPLSRASDINNYGDVVGWTNDSALLWRQSGQVVRLDTLVNLPAGRTLVFAQKINNVGQILLSGSGPGLSFAYLLVPK